MIKQFFKKTWPYFLLLIFATAYLYRFTVKGLIPIPADITVGLYYPWLNQKWETTSGVPVKNPLMSDIVSIIYQWRTLAIDSLKSGQFPFWNSRYFLGMPLFANFQNSLVNFTNIAFFLPLESALSWGLMIFFQLLFSLFSSFYFLRTYRFKKIPSLIGSLIFSLSLFSATWLEYGVHNYTAAFLPLMLAFLRQKRYLLFSLSVALQVYGGYPQYAIYSLIFSSLYFLFLLPKNPRTVSSCFYFIFYIFCGLGLAAPILIPGLELTSLSINKIDLTALESNQGFLPLQNLLTAPSPNYWGNPATYDYQGSGFYDNNSFYPGTIAFIAFLYFLFSFKKISRDSKFFLLTIIFTFLLVIQNPLSSFLKSNLGPIFAKNGLATRFFLLSNLAFAFLSASLINQSKTKFRLPFFFLFIWLVSLLILSQTPFLLSSVALKNTLYAFAFFILIFLFLVLRQAKTLLLLVFLELSYYGWKYLPFSPPKYLFPSTPIIKFLQQNSSNYRIATFDTIPENMWLNYGLKSADGYDTLVPLLNYQYLSLIQDGQLPQSARRARKLTNFNHPLFSSTSTKYVLKQSNDSQSVPTEFNPKNFSLANSEGQVLALENLQVLPRARLLSQVIFSDNVETTAKLLLEEFNPNLAIINFPYHFYTDTITNCHSLQSSVKFIEDTDNFVKLSVETDCPRLLLLSDAYYPGWQAEIDGFPAKIWQTNLSLRSVFVPNGKHQVTFQYQPSFFNLSLVIFLISLLTLITINLIKRRHD